MKISAISFEKYKAFRDPFNIDLKPITVLIGKNSAGKSAIARLPILLKSGFNSNSNSPVELTNSAVSFGASQLDLIHQRRIHGSYSIGYSIENDHHNFSVSAEMQNFVEFKMTKVSNLKLKLDSECLEIVWPRSSNPTLNEYLIENTKESINFRGLFPSDSDIKRIAEKNPLLKKMIPFITSSKDLFDLTSYLGPFRRQPQRVMHYPEGAPNTMGISGAQAASILVDDKLRRGGKVFKRVQDWFSYAMPNWKLSLDEREELFSVVFTKENSTERYQVNIHDVGTGIAQVLPLVVQQCVSSNNKDLEYKLENIGLNIVEQPELHLHPAAHADLADIYARAIKTGLSRFLIETHSENFLLRLRRRVAEGTLSPEDVIIYWIAEDETCSTPQKIEINSDGSLTHWPDGVFSEDYEEIKKIEKARKNLK